MPDFQTTAQTFMKGCDRCKVSIFACLIPGIKRFADQACTETDKNNIESHEKIGDKIYGYLR